MSLLYLLRREVRPDPRRYMGLVVIGGVDDYVCTCTCTDMHTCGRKARKRWGDFFSSWTWNEKKMMIYLELDLGEEEEEEDISTST